MAELMGRSGRKPKSPSSHSTNAVPQFKTAEVGLKNIGWEPPTDLQLAENRVEFRNVYGYANDFLALHDLLDDKKNGAQRGGSNISGSFTETKKGKSQDVEDREPFENYTPIMVVRYL